MGPSLDLELRRERLAPASTRRLSLKQPAKLRGAKSQKNVTRDSTFGKLGQLHVKKQDLSTLVQRSRFKALKGGNARKNKGSHVKDMTSLKDMKRPGQKTPNKSMKKKW